MNTKTMRLPPRRGSLMSTSPTTTHNNNFKRKERDGFDNLTRPSPTTPITATKLTNPSLTRPGPNNPDSTNKLLAGYLAHEFLTKGTLFGQVWNPTTKEGEPPVTKKLKPSEPESSENADVDNDKRWSYVEVSNLLKLNSTHLPKIVNPTQLANYLRL